MLPVGRLLVFYMLFFVAKTGMAQVFKRSELPAKLSIPFEMTYGKDGWLWISESQGRVCKVHPETGLKITVFTANDYADGSPLERNARCTQGNIGSGTLGLALHPEFPQTMLVYLLYSYNSGTTALPATRFKIVELTLNSDLDTVLSFRDLVVNLPNGYDHLGGRLLAVTQSGKHYLYFTTGDNGISEDSQPDCYFPPSSNPNNYAQNPLYPNGKIHRVNMDGTVPADNPLPGNSFFTRGHRNPQGLMYNADRDILFGIEHGDRTDDEINVLEKGMNYGWKSVRGYHGDGNFTGEDSVLAHYRPDSLILGDRLVPAFYSWCSVPASNSNNYLEWCTVAPSDGLYYNHSGIPMWNNCLLVVTLKNGTHTDQELYCFKLSENGKRLLPSTPDSPNPRKYFGEDQQLNGRLRDIAVSPDGKKIYFINNGGFVADKITVYTYVESGVKVYPNPAQNSINIESDEMLKRVEIISMTGKKEVVFEGNVQVLNLTGISKGFHLLKTVAGSGKEHTEKIIVY